MESALTPGHAAAHRRVDLGIAGAAGRRPGGKAIAGANRAQAGHRLLLFPAPVQGADGAFAETVPDRDAAPAHEESAVEFGPDGEGNFGTAWLQLAVSSLAGVLAAGGDVAVEVAEAMRLEKWDG